MKLLTVMCGIPGAGKSTWIDNNCPDAVRLSTEVVRRHQRRRMMSQIGGIKLLAPDLLRQGKHVVIEACSTKLQDRRDWLNVARVSHAPTQLVLVTTDLETCLARQNDRGRTAVPESVVRAHYRRLTDSLPSIEQEGWGEIVRVLSPSFPQPNPWSPCDGWQGQGLAAGDLDPGEACRHQARRRRARR